MELDKDKIEAAIVREAAEKIISDDDLYERVKREVDGRVDKLFARRVEAKIGEAIDAAIRDGFDRPFQKFDGFGRPTGEPTTLSKELEKRVANFWGEMVGRDGKPTDSTYGATKRAEWLMAQICADDFVKEVKQHAINVTGQLKDGFRRELHETVNRLLSELFHVRSADDQAVDRRDSSIIRPKTKA